MGKSKFGQRPDKFRFLYDHFIQTVCTSDQENQSFDATISPLLNETCQTPGAHGPALFIQGDQPVVRF